jgi:hypothetical protein
VPHFIEKSKPSGLHYEELILLTNDYGGRLYFRGVGADCLGGPALSPFSSPPTASPPRIRLPPEADPDSSNVAFTSWVITAGSSSIANPTSRWKPWAPVMSNRKPPRNGSAAIQNYFRAQKMLSSGVVEGLNNKANVAMRKSYGFRTYRVLELALYHSLGKLPEPESTHDFF